MAWRFIVPRAIFFGEAALETVGKRVAKLGACASVITGRNAMRRSGMLDRVVAALTDAGVDPRAFEGVPPEPTFDAVDAATAFTRSSSADVVIGLGGGSVMDVAKVAAFLAPTTLSVRALYKGVPMDCKGLSYVAVPTTAGTGSEVTPNAVLTDPETRIKSSIRGEALLADLVICDPAATLTAPPHVTAYAGMDAFTQAVEAYVSRGATPLTEAIAREAAVRVARNICAAYSDGANLEARTEMLLGSMMGGIALANARSGAVHGMAHPVGSRYSLAHGLVCAMLLPHVIQFNSDPVYDGASLTAAKYAWIAKALDLVPQSAPDSEAVRSLVGHVEKLNDLLGIPKHMADFGLCKEDFPEIIERSMPSGSLAHNPRKVSPDDVADLLDAAV